MPPKGKKRQLHAVRNHQDNPNAVKNHQNNPNAVKNRQDNLNAVKNRQDNPNAVRKQLTGLLWYYHQNCLICHLAKLPHLNRRPHPLRQAPASQSGTNTQSLQPRQAPASQSGTTTQSLQPRQAPASQSEATFQLPLPRQAPATLLSSQETIETVPSRLQSQQSAHLEMISSQESITSRVQNQLLLSQTPELFDEPIRGGDYDTSLNYWVKDEHQFGESSTAGMVRGAILEADARPTIPSASNCLERSTPVESVDSPLNELLPKGA